MNTFPNAEKSTKTSTTTTTITKRAPLTKAFITPKEFVDLVSEKSNNQDVPILDCRSQMDFGCERIRSSHNINCRTKIMARKLTSKRLEDVEPNLSSSLHNSDIVILYDQSTDVPEEDKIRSLPINLVVQAAQKSNKIVQIIQDAVKTEFPHLIECAPEAPKCKTDDDLPPLPASPDTIDKENIIMSEIVPHIYVGNICDAQNLDRLTEHGITHIINCTPDLPFYWEKKHEYLRLDVLDLPSQNIRKHFETAIDFIDKALQSNGKVLVHCSAGISRSPTLVLAYLMKKKRWTLDEAFEKMRKLRRIVDPNVSFIIQLREWEKTLMANAVTEPNEDNLGATSRSTSSGTYCGSTSKTKSESKACATTSDAAITVN
ncbi:unnamed protein product [Adineta ricciae]|uniref:Protein-serine/threonine phosphatase n=1 Tax=Adineta ricciae TaxID=249248 RepID=A0A814GHY3_ADIRI|nr:unnamed protein product [Adineta ricciae]